MSYDIDNFKLKKIENLNFPVKELFTHERQDWHFTKIYNVDGTTTFEGMGTILKGSIKDDVFHLNEISCSGEGSGTEMSWILEPALKKSKGVLVASCVWESGGLINKLEVCDGALKWTDIEI